MAPTFTFLELEWSELAVVEVGTAMPVVDEPVVDWEAGAVDSGSGSGRLAK